MKKVCEHMLSSLYVLPFFDKIITPWVAMTDLTTGTVGETIRDGVTAALHRTMDVIYNRSCPKYPHDWTKTWIREKARPHARQISVRVHPGHGGRAFLLQGRRAKQALER